jgi:hypothetical protein
MRACCLSTVVLFGFLAPLSSTAAMAQNAPAQLRRKSIIATWTENRMQRPAGKGEFRPLNIPNGLSIYVSTAGRTFVRRSASGRGGQGTASRDSFGSGASAGGAHATQFRGRALNVTASFVAGAARMIAIQFDERFSGCTAAVVIGRQAGGGIIRMKSYAGDDLEIQSASAGAATCAIRDGNVLAD